MKCRILNSLPSFLIDKLQKLRKSYWKSTLQNLYRCNDIIRIHSMYYVCRHGILWNTDVTHVCTNMFTCRKYFYDILCILRLARCTVPLCLVVYIPLSIINHFEALQRSVEWHLLFYLFSNTSKRCIRTTRQQLGVSAVKLIRNL